MLKAIQYHCVTTNLFGPGSLKILNEEIKTRKLGCALIVTDKSLVKAGVVASVEKVLSGAGVTCTLFDEVIPNPGSRNRTLKIWHNMH